MWSLLANPNWSITTWAFGIREPGHPSAPENYTHFKKQACERQIVFDRGVLNDNMSKTAHFELTSVKPGKSLSEQAQHLTIITWKRCIWIGFHSTRGHEHATGPVPQPSRLPPQLRQYPSPSPHFSLHETAGDPIGLRRGWRRRKGLNVAYKFPISGTDARGKLVSAVCHPCFSAALGGGVEGKCPIPTCKQCICFSTLGRSDLIQGHIRKSTRVMWSGYKAWRLCFTD